MGSKFPTPNPNKGRAKPPASPAPPTPKVPGTDVDLGNLSFESGFESDAPPRLWRLLSWREFAGKPLRHTNWFATKEAAEAHAAWINDGRGKVVAITEYVQRPTESEAGK